MQLNNAKLGQKYRLYTDSEGNMVGDKVHKTTIVGTVIATYPDGSAILFGWKPGEEHPHNAKNRDGLNPSASYRYAADQKSYNFSLSMKAGGLIHSKVAGPGEFDGCQCKKCHTFYAYAEPNQEDGTLVCYSCRMSW